MLQLWLYYQEKAKQKEYQTAILLDLPFLGNLRLVDPNENKLKQTQCFN